MTDKQALAKLLQELAGPDPKFTEQLTQTLESVDLGELTETVNALNGVGFLMVSSGRQGEANDPLNKAITRIVGWNMEAAARWEEKLKLGKKEHLMAIFLQGFCLGLMTPVQLSPEPEPPEEDEEIALQRQEDEKEKGGNGETGNGGTA